MLHWLTPRVAAILMIAGVAPSLANVYLLYDERRQPGVMWFLVSMIIGALWALLFTAITVSSSPTLTLFLANFFWAVIPAAAAAMFLFAYEFVFRTTASRTTVIILFSPVALLFLLSWTNPNNLIFTSDYYVTSDGFLHFSQFGGLLKFLVTKIYGYLLVVLGAGIFIGEIMRTSGLRRRQTVYILSIFSLLVVSTLIKVAGFVPEYFDPTSVVYSFSGLLFAVSIRRQGLLQHVPIAREQSFDTVEEAIIVIGSNGSVIDVNRSGKRLFKSNPIGRPRADLFSNAEDFQDAGEERLLQLKSKGQRRYFSFRQSPVSYGRGLQGNIIILSEITALKEREQELELLKQVLSRVLRHNIRNDLTVIAGRAELIRDSADEQIAAQAEEILDRADHLVSQSEKARQLEEVLLSDQTITGDLDQVVVEAVDQLRGTYPHATIKLSVEKIPVELHPHFGIAIQELIENAIKHYQGTGTPNITVSSEDHGEYVQLSISDNGPGIPQTELDVLAAEEETDLKHGSGIGLWLVRWIVEASNGELAPEITETGTRINIHLQQTSSSDNNID